MDDIVAEIEKKSGKEAADIHKESGKQIKDLKNNQSKSQQKLEKDLKSTSNDLVRLSSPECTADSKLVNLSDEHDVCFEGSENKISNNADQGSTRVEGISQRYAFIKEFLKECDRIHNDKAAKNCAEGKVSLKIISQTSIVANFQHYRSSVLKELRKEQNVK